jgi:hypothetical protein
MVLLCAALAKRFTLQMTFPPQRVIVIVICTYQSKLFVYRLRLHPFGAGKCFVICALDAKNRARRV